MDKLQMSDDIVGDSKGSVDDGGVYAQVCVQ